MMAEESCGIGAMTVLEADAAITPDAASPAQQAEAEADFARARHRRRMDALAHWLSYTKGWTPREAAALALGVLPNDAHSLGFGEPLPGTEPWPRRESWEDRMRRDIVELAARLATIAGFGFMPAAKQLAAIQKHHGPLPWWPWAREDEICAPLLPATAETSQRPSKGRRKPTDAQRRENAQKASRARWGDPKKEPARNALLTFGRSCFEEEKQKDFRDHRWGEGVSGAALAGTIDNFIQKKLPDDPDSWPALATIEDQVRRWLAEPDSRDAKHDSRDATA